MRGLALRAQPALLIGIPRPARLRCRGESERQSFHARAVRHRGGFVIPMREFALLTRRRKMLVIALREELSHRAVDVMARAAAVHAVEATGLCVGALRSRVAARHEAQNA